MHISRSNVPRSREASAMSHTSTRSKFLPRITAFLAAATMAVTCGATSAQALEDHVVNSDFEYPAKTDMSKMGDWTMIDPALGQYYASQAWYDIDGWQLGSFGWSSTQTINSGINRAGAVEVQVESGTSNHYAELVCSQAATSIYQDVATTPGAVYKWSLRHASLNTSHVDTASVLLGSVSESGTAQAATRATVNGNGDAAGMVGTIFGTKVSNTADRDHAKQWETYTGTYVVPDGQVATRLSFLSVSGESDTGGNLLDDISFSAAYPIWYDANYPTGSTGAGDVPDTGLNPTTGVYDNYFMTTEDADLTDVSDANLTATSAAGESYVLVGWSKTPSGLCTSYDEIQAAGVVTSYGNVAASGTDNKVYAVWATKDAVTTHDLTLRKAATSQTGIQDGTTFTFKVGFTTPGDAALAGTLNYMVNGIEASTTLGSDGTATVSGIAANDMVVFENIPEGCKWAIEETSYWVGTEEKTLVGNWSTTWTSSIEDKTPTHDSTASSGTLSKDTTVSYTNTDPAQCDLTISKTVMGAASGTTFSFNIAIKDASGNPIAKTFSYTKSDGSSGEVVFGSTGEGTISGVKDGESVKVLDLPYGTNYTVTEVDPGTGWTTTNQRQRSVVIRSNTYTNQAVDGYNTWPTSIVSYLPPADDSEGKTATITDLPTVPDGSLVVVKQMAQGANPNPATDGTGNTASFFTADQDGSGIKITAGDGYKLFKNAIYAPVLGGRLYVYVDYNYPVVTGREATGTLTMDEGVTYTNVNETHDLTISKTTAGTGAPTDATFNFTVGLTNAQGNPLAGTYSYTTSTGSTGTITLDASGEATLPAIGNGATVTIKDLPAGSTWSVDEASWTLGPVTSSLAGTWSTGWTNSTEDKTPTHDGTASTGTLAADTTVSYTNTSPATCSLTVSKTTDGPVPKGSTFSFGIVLKDGKGNPVTGTYPYVGTDGKTGTLDFGTTGTATVSGVTSDQEFTISGLPYGSTYTVTENDPGTTANPSSNWTTTNQRDRGIVIRANSYTATAADGFCTWPSPVTYYIDGTTTGSTGTIADIPTIPTGSEIKCLKAAGANVSPNPATDGDSSGLTKKIYTASLNGTGGIDLEATAMWSLMFNNSYKAVLGQYYLYVDYNYPVIGDDAGENGAISTGTLTTDESVAYTNTYNSHDLSISKTAKGSDLTGATFNFSVGLLDGAGNPLTGTYAYATKDSTGAQTGSGTITLDVNGKAAISGVASGNTVTIKDLPSGTVWSVDEETWTLAGDTQSLAGKWSTSWMSSIEDETPSHDGTAASGTLSADTTVSYTNETPAKANLTIAKTVKGNTAPDGTTFSFDILMKDKDGNALTGDYSYIKPAGGTGTLTFVEAVDASGNPVGKATVSGVTGDQEFTIEGLPYGSTYTVTEADSGTGWSTTNQRDRSIVLRNNGYTATAVDGYYTWPTAITAYLPGGGTATISDIPAIPTGSTAVLKKASAVQANPNPGSDPDETKVPDSFYTTTVNADGTLGLTAGSMWVLANNAAYAPKMGQWYLYLDYNYASVTGREATGTVTTDESVTFTNTYQSTTWTPGVTKTLADGSDTVMTAPDFTFSIAADATTSDAPMPKRTTATAKGLTTATFDAITYNEAGTYVYDITETKGSAGGWTYDGDTLKATVVVSADQTTGALSTKVTYTKAGDAITAPTFANTFKVGSTDISVTTAWVDNSNAEKTRPDDATYLASLHLYTSDGTGVTATPTVVKNANNTWSVTYTGLPQYTSDGSTISYYVTQGTSAGYKAPAYSGDGHALAGGTITNTLADPTTVDISGTKVWDDFSNAAKTRPSSVTLTLANDGTAATTGYEPVWTNTTGNTWTWTYTGLPKYDESGKELSWTVTETRATGYDAPDYGTGKASAGNGGTITNRLTDRHDSGTFSATISWDDFSDVDKVRPTTAQIKASLTLTADGGTSAAVPSVVDNGDNTFTVTYDNLATYNADGSTVVYALTQGQVTGYDAPTFSGGGATVANGGTITNRLTDRHDSGTFSATISWDDFSDVGKVRPTTDQIKASLTLTADGVGSSAVPTVVDNGDNTFTVSYAGLPTYAADGTTISYLLSQSQVTDYDAPTFSGGGATVADGGTITNRLTDRHDSGTFSATISWDDFSNVDKVRPTADQIRASLTFTADGAASAAVPTVVDNGDNTYTVSYDNLATHTAGGTAISYLLSQSQVTGYDAPTFSGGGATVANGGTITNRLTDRHDSGIFSATIAWDDFSNVGKVRPTVDELKASLTLTADGAASSAVPTVVDNGDNTFTVSYDNLATHTAGGTAISYLLSQSQVTGYDAPTFSGGGATVANGGTITNRLTDRHDSGTFSVTTKWIDNSDAEGKRPDDAAYLASLHLYTPGGTEVTATPNVVDNGNNTWSVTYTGLPQYASDGTSISYYVTQGTATSYKAPAYSGDGHALDGGTITDALADPATVDISGTKAWDDFSNAAKTRPASVTLTLANDGTAATTGYEPVWTNTDTNTWTWTYTDLPKYDESRQAAQLDRHRDQGGGL
jgi:pilin isopeptide linkage protein